METTEAASDISGNKPDGGATIAETSASGTSGGDVTERSSLNRQDEDVYRSNSFTSEIFKIEIMNLPRFCGFKVWQEELKLY